MEEVKSFSLFLSFNHFFCKSIILFHDLGDKRKPEYLERIVFDALEQGAKMKDRIITELQKANLPCEAATIREVVKWNRIEHKEHTSEEIKKFFKD